MGKGAIGGNSELYAGTTALSQKDHVHRAIECADLVVTVGHDTVEKPPFIMLPSGPRVVHVDSHPADIDQIYFPQIEVIGDIGESMTQLADALEGKVPPISDKLKAIRDQVLAQIGGCSSDRRYPMVPQRIVSDVRAVLPEDGILCLDNGMFKIWFARNYRTHISNTILLDNALATMGAGLPSAMMSAMLYPRRRVMAVCGDGGFMMNSQELETAIRLRLDIVVLILEDGKYGMIRWKQEIDGFEDFGLNFGNPDFVKYAEAYGAKGTRICTPDELRPTLEDAFQQGGVHVVVVPIDYSENHLVLGAEPKTAKTYRRWEPDPP
jgi:acetolactate synthase-1/2/3 large subunit